jgi:hypothetical protein
VVSLAVLVAVEQLQIQGQRLEVLVILLQLLQVREIMGVHQLLRGHFMLLVVAVEQVGQEMLAVQ